MLNFIGVRWYYTSIRKDGYYGEKKKKKRFPGTSKYVSVLNGYSRCVYFKGQKHLRTYTVIAKTKDPKFSILF